MTVWNTLFDTCLQEIGVLASGETGGTSDRALCLARANLLLGAWSRDLDALYFQTTESLTWSGGNTSRTIGSGGNFNTTRPQRIIRAQYRIDSNDYDLDLIDHDIYQGITDKSSQSNYPEAIAYNPTNASGLGTLFVWPVPSSEMTLLLTSYKPFTAISDPTADSGLPPGYEDAFVLNLSYRLQKPFLKINDPQLERDADAAYRALKTPSATLNPSSADDLLPGSNGTYNILADL